MTGGTGPDPTQDARWCRLTSAGAPSCPGLAGLVSQPRSPCVIATLHMAAPSAELLEGSLPPLDSTRCKAVDQEALESSHCLSGLADAWLPTKPSWARTLPLMSPGDQKDFPQLHWRLLQELLSLRNSMCVPSSALHPKQASVSAGAEESSDLRGEVRHCYQLSWKNQAPVAGRQDH